MRKPEAIPLGRIQFTMRTSYGGGLARNMLVLHTLYSVFHTEVIREPRSTECYFVRTVVYITLSLVICCYSMPVSDRRETNLDL